MPQTPSNPIPLGTPAADFSLSDHEGRLHTLADFAGKPALLVAFLSNRCPFVLHIRQSFAAFTSEFQTKGLEVVAFNSNDAEAYPEESAQATRLESVRAGYFFPYLKDSDQQVARRYGAACTPDFFLFDRDLRLSYHGQFDASRPKNGSVSTGEDLRQAAMAVLAGKEPAGPQTPSIGCNIKWLAGNEPAWFAAGSVAA